MPYQDALNEIAMEEDDVFVVWFVSLVLDGSVLNLMSGSLADITFNPGDGALTFVAVAADGTTLDTVQNLSSGVGIEAIRPNIRLLPESDDAAGDLLDDAVDGGRARLWFSPLDRDTGQPVGTPEAILDGEIDMAWIRAGAGVSVIDIECRTAAEALHDAGEGFAMNGPSHKSIWPGELGFDFAGYLRRPLHTAASQQGNSPVQPGPIGGIINQIRRRLADV